MKKWILPDKSIDKENVQYEWVAESGACDVCQEMSGSVYDSANDIPDRPHPNCKCHIEIIEKENENKKSDPLEDITQKRKDKSRILLEIKELFGRTNSVMEEIDEYVNQVNTEEAKFKEFTQVIDVNSLEPEDKQKLTKAVQDINIAKNKGQETKNQLLNLQKEIRVLEGGVEVTNILSFIIGAFEAVLKALVGTLSGIVMIVKELVLVIGKILASDYDKFLEILAFKTLIADKYGEKHSQKHNMPESLNLYKVASTNQMFNSDYIKKNGKVYTSINDLNNYRLEKEIHSRVKSEMGLDDCKVLKLRPDSSLAKEIEQSNALKSFVSQYKNELVNTRNIDGSKELKFENDDSDMFSALHSSVAKNIHLDSNDNLCFQVEDFYNFNPGRTSGKGKLGRWLQYYEMLKPYYLTIEIKIPKTIWENYIK